MEYENEPQGWPESVNGMIMLPEGIETEDGVFRWVRLREITGHEEDMFGNRQMQRDGSTLMNVIASCVTGIGYDAHDDIDQPNKIKTMVAKMSLSDGVYLTARLRALSLGDEFRYRMKCPHCPVTSHFVCDLSRQPRRFFSEQLDRSLEFTVLDRRVKARRLRFEDNPKLIRIKREMGDKQFSMELLLRVAEIDGVEQRSYVDMQKLSSRFRNELRDMLYAREAGMDVDVLNTCPSCRAEFECTLPIGSEDFFFPSGRKKR